MKGRSKKGTGGTNDAEDDLKDKPVSRNAPNKVTEEAEERKSGGRAKHAAGGRTARKEGGKTEVGKMHGEKSKMHMGRKPRASGGRTGSDQSPFTSARKGTAPKGRTEMMESDW